MKKMRHLIVPVIALVMSLVFCFTGCANTIDAIHQSVSEQAECSVTEDSDAVKADNSKRGELSQVEGSNNEPGKIVDVGTDSSDQSTFVNIDTTVADSEINAEDANSFAIYETAYKISTMGYDVYRGAAVINENQQAYGLVYTSYDKDAEGNYTGGFLELIDETQTPIITDEIVEAGLVAVADSETQTNGFIIDRFVSLQDSSGIFGDYYFTSKQTGNYAVTINVVADNANVYDEDIDLIDYNTGKTKWLADVAPTMSFEACSLYTADEAEAYNTAVKALQEIVALQNSNYYESQYCSLIVIETALLESIALNDQTGVIGTEDGYYDLTTLNEIELEANQILVVTASDGVQVLTIPTAEELKAASDTRTVKGIIEAVSGVLLAVGSIAICVVTCGTATPVVAAVSVIAGSIATTYAISNIVEGVSDIYYGVNGDITSSAINPVKDLIVKAVGDDKTGTIIYHAIGISASLIQHLLMPINAGLQLANLLHAGIGQTIYIITRVVAVEVVKMAVTAGLSYLTSIGLSKVTTKLTGSEAAGLLVGYTGALIVGFVTYNGLTALDKKFNFSGIYVKAGLGKAYIDTKLRDSALKHFNESEWNNMTLAEKKANIQQLAKIIADELGLENAPKVKYYYEMDNTYGYYYDGDNTLNINTYYFTKGDAPYVEIVDTIAHETRHAYQYARLLNGVYDDISESYVHYISADTNKALYYSQACEVDAFGYGEYWANLLQGVLGV